jgi:hypothetical protein
MPSSSTQDTQNTQDTQDTHAIQDIQDPAGRLEMPGSNKKGRLNAIAA